MMPLRNLTKILQNRGDEKMWQLLLKVTYDKDDALDAGGPGFIIFDDVNIKPEDETYALTAQGVYTGEFHDQGDAKWIVIRGS
jgi:hypothetical protein